ncbi:Hypothetical protein PENO1_080070 [Penicillium occitanis (nom. inval.)]|nr:Hypothetical protein PENO1_080070 [Penicillium occitanis (nom. inval.)]PCG94426.1 hypothetical protein PENOC_082890 [Penicillium occitanis (nom. inval.)]
MFQSYTLPEDLSTDLIANFGRGKMKFPPSDKPSIHSAHGQVHDWFLSKNDILLVSDEFDNTENSAVINLSHDPLILSLALETFEKYPILDPEAYPNPKIAEAMLAYSDYKNTRAEFFGMPRVIARIYKHSSTVGSDFCSKAISVNHGLYGGVSFANHFGHKYHAANLFEYDSKLERFGGDKPHLIMLAEIEEYCFDGSISYGELALLITAMRNRAFQRYGFVGSDSESDDESPDKGNVPVNNGFLFEHEQQFPVLLVYIVGLQHARISYACMDELKIVIRQSKKYNLLKKDEETLNFLSRILLSSPLEDDQLAELIQK